MRGEKREEGIKLKGEKREGKREKRGREKFEILINSVKYPRENSLRQRKGKWRKTRSNGREEEKGQKGERSVRKKKRKYGAK